MNQGFIGQGLHLQNHSVAGLGKKTGEKDVSQISEVVYESIRDDQFSSCRIATAFAQSSAVDSLQDLVENQSRELDMEVIVGIDFKTTPVEALRALVESGFESRLFTADGITYHPKVYYFEGETMQRVIVGSANMTQQGLNQNIEAAILLESERRAEEPAFKDLLTFLNTLSNKSHQLTHERIDALQAAGEVVTEAEMRARTSNTTSSDATSENVSSEQQSILDELKSDIPIQGIRRPASQQSGDAVSVPEDPDKLQLPPRSEMPPIPHADSLRTKTDENYYRQLVNDEHNQPSRMRRLIRSRNEISQAELKAIFRDTYGYNISGSFGASLHVLTDVTEEVRTEGEGPSRRLIWDGE